MASIPPEDSIRAFWQWFVSIAPRLERDFEDMALHGLLDEHLGRLGDMTWELGPGLRAENSLTVTPDGDVEWLPATRKIISLAPGLEGWEFHAAKPPRHWDLQFLIEADSGELVEVDARLWRYVLYRLKGGGFDVVLEHSNMDFDDEDDAYRAAAVLVDGVLGEGVRLTHIRGIEPVAQLTEDQSRKANTVDMLAKHLESMLH